MPNVEEQGGAKLVNLKVNGDEYQLMIEPQESLREVLHDRIGLTGTKEMCDRGACGSCTVIMDGRPILSCMALAIECGGHNIETIEKINNENHPLIDAYADNHAMQCGYCTPGFVVTAKALLDRNPSPSKEDIKTALEGNICRCGTYPAHILAVEEAAKKLDGKEGI